MSITIHGKEYITVAERLELAKKDIVGIETQVLFQEPVVIQATIILKDGRKANGISAANPTKMLEKMSPYEVAETSAIGRALGFLGYGIVNGIATADEIKKVDPTDEWPDNMETTTKKVVTGNICTCGTKNKYHSKSCPMFK